MPIPWPMLLMLLGGGIGQRALPALLKKFASGMMAKKGAGTVAGLLGDTIGSGAGYIAAEGMNPEVTEGNGPAFSQLQNKLNQPQDPLSANYMEMLQEMGVDPRRML